MKFKEYASKKVIAIFTAALLVIGGLTGQYHKINTLEKELYIQQNMTEQKYNYTETQPDISSIEDEINKICEYKILDGTFNIKHKYAYERDGLLGMDHRYILTGTADYYYELITNLSTARVISATNDKIKIEVSYPQVNDEACHRVANTFYRLDDECDKTLLSNKLDAEKCTRQWEDSFDTKGLQFVKEYYTYDDVRKDTEKATIDAIKILLEELGYSQSLEVIVK